MEPKKPRDDERLERLLRIGEVLRLTGMSKSTIHRKWRSGEFPAPIKLFPDSRLLGWRQSEISDWMKSRERAT